MLKLPKNEHIRAVLYLLAWLSTLSFTAIAGEMYKWQDGDGVWHFSSTPPKSEKQFETIELPANPQPLVSMRKLGLDREPEYAFVNNIWGPVELELRFNEAENVTSDPPLPARLVLPARSEQRLLKIKATDPYQSFSYQLSYHQMIGPPLSQLPAGVNYYPPFPQGMKFPISQGFDNDITHSEPPNQYAVDIVMPVGTPVLAARSGSVMDTEDNFRGGAQLERYLTRANQVRILHDDGTMAVYAHLQANSVRVKPGARI
jgi:murein DD-endopeptidase MepM/ murein hydrolase activator NlpD